MSKDMMKTCNIIAPMFLRIVVGLVLFVPGTMKLYSLITTGNAGVSAMLGGVVAFAWILALVEFVAGGMVIANYKAGWAAVPLMVIMFAAAIMTTPWNSLNLTTNILSGGFLWHILAVAALFQIHVTGCTGICGTKHKKK